MAKYEIYEDNGGGVYLVIQDDAGKPVKIFENWEYPSSAGVLRDALEQLRADPTAWEMWDGDLLERLNNELIWEGNTRPPITVDELYREFDNPGNTLVAWGDDDGEVVWPDRMGFAAKCALGVPDEGEENE